MNGQSKLVAASVRLMAKIAHLSVRLLSRESLLIRVLNPIYNQFIGWSQGGEGIHRVINGVPCIIDQRYYRGPDYYEPTVAAFLRQKVQPGDMLIDVGAHIGLYVFQFARWSGPTGRVLAFEPNPAAREGLGRHLQLNHLADRVEIVPFAVGEMASEETFYASGSDPQSRLQTVCVNMGPRVSRLSVKVVTLDDWCPARGVVPQWLLIDIEGFEIAALKGARSLITSRHSQLGLVVEMHPQFWAAAGTSRDQAELLLNDLGLCPIPLTGQVDPLAEYGVVHLEYV
jgi:FkbM family methyltransferase